MRLFHPKGVQEASRSPRHTTQSNLSGKAEEASTTFTIGNRLATAKVSRNSLAVTANTVRQENPGFVGKPRVAPSQAGGAHRESFGLRACLLHHFHQNFTGLSRIFDLPQECDARAPYAVGGL